MRIIYNKMVSYEAIKDAKVYMNVITPYGTYGRKMVLDGKDGKNSFLKMLRHNINIMMETAVGEGFILQETNAVDVSMIEIVDKNIYINTYSSTVVDFETKEKKFVSMPVYFYFMTVDEFELMTFTKDFNNIIRMAESKREEL
jgi:3-hydroxyisobutyrate dehydrogenase-like beta-hydroxyacid dehydrogenase